jgi:hypothetical protein
MLAPTLVATSGSFVPNARCRLTQRVGIYQLSHWDTEHIDNFAGNFRGNRPPRSPSNPADETTPPPVTPSTTGTPSGTPSSAPQSNLTSFTPSRTVTLLPPGPPEVSIHPDLSIPDDDDPDAIEFLGMWCMSVLDAPAANASIVGHPIVQLECQLARTLERESGVYADAQPSCPLPLEDDEDIFFDPFILDDSPFDDDLHLFADSYEELDAIATPDDPTNANVIELTKVMPFPPTMGWFPHLQTLVIFWITVMIWDSILYWFEAPVCPLIFSSHSSVKTSTYTLFVSVFLANLQSLHYASTQLLFRTRRGCNLSDFIVCQHHILLSPTSSIYLPSYRST